MAQTPPTIGPFKRIVNVGWGGPIGILEVIAPQNSGYALERVVPSLLPVPVPGSHYYQDPNEILNVPEFIIGDEIKKSYPADPTIDDKFWDKAYLESLLWNGDVSLAASIGHETIPTLWVAGGDDFAAYYRGAGGTDAQAWAVSGPGHTAAEVIAHYQAAPYLLDILSTGPTDIAYSGDLGTTDVYCHIGDPSSFLGTISNNLAWFVRDPPCAIYYGTWSFMFKRRYAERLTWLINFNKLGSDGEIKLLNDMAADLDSAYDTQLHLRIYAGGKFFADTPLGTVLNDGGTMIYDDTRLLSFSMTGSDLLRIKRTGFV